MAGSSQKWRLISPFFIILTLHCIAIVFFTRGFLLTRTELPNFSQCSDTSQSPCSNPNTNTTDTRCWTKPTVDRLVIIVLDALRFDFVAPSTFFDEKRPWMDKLKVLQKLASDEPSSARIFKAIADPPTTSLQRLKMVRNGKRVMMVGDDTWVQLFPDHFEKSFPFPSFNVKDLDTVDDGCIQHLFPSLYMADWDVLIAHFLGVDHAGHIFGVDSSPMIDKLEQYNVILEKVTEILKNQSGPGGLHENTLLLVMGDHGQTINGDHGGGTAEEVETSIFAMSTKIRSRPFSSELDMSCKFDTDGKEICVSSVQQLDFAVTMAALLGIPFPFGSIGRVNPDLYALSAGSRNQPVSVSTECKEWSNFEEWGSDYANVLCINSWQVKKYIDVYSASSIIGFPSEDLLHVENMYAQAQVNWSNTVQNCFLSENENCNTSFTGLRDQINAYSNFLASVAELARSKWTEFDLPMMYVGLGIMILSLFVHLVVIIRANKFCQISYPYSGYPEISLRLTSAIFLVAIRGCSFLSNSYILTEGKVASFLLGTTGILSLRYSFIRKKMLIEAFGFLLLNSILRLITTIELSKQSLGFMFTSIFPVKMLGIDRSHPVWLFIPEIIPLLLVPYLLYKSIVGNPCWRVLKYFFLAGTVISYMLIMFYLALESNVLAVPPMVEDVERNFVPRIIYAIGFGQVVLLTFVQFFEKAENTLHITENITIKTMLMLSAWSPTIIVLLGGQGSFIALASIVGGWCVIRLGISEEKTWDITVRVPNTDPLPIAQWSLFAICLFFYTGHWCAFDGLRYSAAFIGFDEFNLIRQAILLSIDTFGVSHILPILGLPFLVVFQYLSCQGGKGKEILHVKLSQTLLMSLLSIFSFSGIPDLRTHYFRDDYIHSIPDLRTHYFRDDYIHSNMCHNTKTSFDGMGAICSKIRFRCGWPSTHG
ncbi:hypothetical protein GIB67_029327 [Kingdonia uniflora]|uniref:GPI ethanolamine phosphate transferase 3 n=1 Tax=Kingdonia uniflora TaxID=39325 RepID=A0A7J7N9B2_9MAGN|nr:hypothetical protein GIB67_029327 [Kingdonia uniflora]